MNIFYYYFKYVVFRIKIFIMICYQYFYPVIKQKTLTENNEIFFDKYKKKLTNALTNHDKFNTNLIPEFNDINKLNNLVNNNKNYENIWKNRILYVNTPMGNIYLYYDVYKMAFVYFCDKIASSDVLNAVAIKYVTTYFCIDLYVNEKDIGIHVDNNNHLKALIKYNDYDKPKLIHNTDNRDDSGVFVKKKPNPNEKKQNKKQQEQEQQQEQEREYFKNKFIYAGKMYSAKLLKRDIIYPNNNFKSSLLDNISTEKNRVSWKDFKKNNT